MLCLKTEKPRNEKVSLIGMMGTGKSKFGRIVANNLNFNFYDIDTLIENKFKTTIKNLFQKEGEVFFRKEEKQTIKNLICKIKTNNEKVIISLGGGGFDDEDTRELLLNNTFVIWLHTPVNILVNRIGDGSKRPMIRGDAKEAINKLLNIRTKYYSLCDYKLSTNRLTQYQVTEKIIKLIYSRNNKEIK